MNKENSVELRFTKTVDYSKRAQKLAVEYKQLEKGYREQLYKLVGNAYAVGLGFINNEESYLAFLRLPFFESGKGPKEGGDEVRQTMKEVMFFITDARSKQTRDRAGKFAKLMAASCKKGAKPKEFLARLRDKGIEAMLNELGTFYLDESPRGNSNGKKEYANDDEEESSCEKEDDDDGLSKKPAREPTVQLTMTHAQRATVWTAKKLKIIATVDRNEADDWKTVRASVVRKLA